MQQDLFGVVDLDSIPKKKRNKPLNIHLKLGKVCIGKKTFICRAIPYSPNYLNKKHWAVRARWKDAWEQEIWGRWMESRGEWKDYSFPLPFKIILTAHFFCIREQDYDNAIASLKGIIDGIVKAGIIKDDTYNHIVPKVKFVPVKTKAAEHVEILINKYVRK